AARGRRGIPAISSRLEPAATPNSRPAGSEHHRQADFDDLRRFDAVVVARRAGVAAHPRVERLLPAPHLRVAAGQDHLAVEVVDHAAGLDRHALGADAFHELLDVGGFHIAVAPDHAPDPLADLAYGQPFVVGHGRDLL